jgi:hypothetical protein
LRNVQRSVVVQQAESVTSRWAIHNGSGDDLVHGFVVLRS